MSTFNGLAVHVLLVHVIVVLALESHVSEVIDGMPARSEPGAVPRPEYDVTRTTLRQRELAKVAELERTVDRVGSISAVPPPVLRCRDRRAGRQTAGAAIDGDGPCRRTLCRRLPAQQPSPPRKHVLTENTGASTGTATRLKRLVDKAVERERSARLGPKDPKDRSCWPYGADHVTPYLKRVLNGVAVPRSPHETR